VHLQQMPLLLLIRRSRMKSTAHVKRMGVTRQDFAWSKCSGGGGIGTDF
jgi:hypothetical protein